MEMMLLVPCAIFKMLEIGHDLIIHGYVIFAVKSFWLGFSCNPAVEGVADLAKKC